MCSIASPTEQKRSLRFPMASRIITRLSLPKRCVSYERFHIGMDCSPSLQGNIAYPSAPYQKSIPANPESQNNLRTASSRTRSERRRERVIRFPPMHPRGSCKYLFQVHHLSVCKNLHCSHSRCLEHQFLHTNLMPFARLLRLFLRISC